MRSHLVRMDETLFGAAEDHMEDTGPNTTQVQFSVSKLLLPPRDPSMLRSVASVC